MNQLALADPRQATKEQLETYDLSIKTSNKEVRDKMERKYATFTKLIGSNKAICRKYDSSILADSYLTFTGKINGRAFEEVCTKVVGEECRVEKDRDRKMVNHVPGCFYLHSKKLLFQYMSKYYKKYLSH